MLSDAHIIKSKLDKKNCKKIISIADKVKLGGFTISKSGNSVKVNIYSPKLTS